MFWFYFKILIVSTFGKIKKTKNSPVEAWDKKSNKICYLFMIINIFLHFINYIFFREEMLQAMANLGKVF